MAKEEKAHQNAHVPETQQDVEKRENKGKSPDAPDYCGGVKM